MSELTTLTSLIDLTAQELDTTKVSVKRVVDEFLSQLVAAIESGETVRISSLGTFGTVDTAARTGRNPTTGEALEIAASKRVTFKATASLKRAVKPTAE